MAFRCAHCGLHFSEKEDAEACTRWCASHDSCNLAVARRSLEATGQAVPND